MKLTAADREVIEYFLGERERLKKNPLWRAAWLAAKDNQQLTFWFDGVEWWV